LEVKKISYSNFHKNKFKKGEKHWLVVTEYPIMESFYDKTFKDNTNKFEVFFVSDGKAIEIASAGIVGSNMNKKMSAKNADKLSDKNIFDKEFIGFGLGIERLILLYS